MHSPLKNTKATFPMAGQAQNHSKGETKSVCLDTSTGLSSHRTFFVGSGRQRESTIVHIQRPDCPNTPEANLPKPQEFCLTQTIEGVRFSLNYTFRRFVSDGQQYTKLGGSLKVIDAAQFENQTKILSFAFVAPCNDWYSTRQISRTTQAIYEAFLDDSVAGLYRVLHNFYMENPQMGWMQVYPRMHEVMESLIDDNDGRTAYQFKKAFDREDPQELEEDEQPPHPPEEINKAYDTWHLIEEICREEYAEFAIRNDPELITIKFSYPEDFADSFESRVSMRKLILRPIIEAVARTREGKGFNDIQLHYQLRQYYNSETEESCVKLQNVTVCGPRHWLFFREKYQIPNKSLDVHITEYMVDQIFFRPLFKSLHESNCEFVHCRDVTATPIYSWLRERGYQPEPKGLFARLKSFLKIMKV